MFAIKAPNRPASILIRVCLVVTASSRSPNKFVRGGDARSGAVTDSGRHCPVLQRMCDNGMKVKEEWEEGVMCHSD